MKKRKMENKYLATLLLGIFLLTALSSLVMAASFTVNLDVPAASSVIRGSAVNFSATASNTGDINFTCDIYAGSSSTANTTWTQLTSAGIQNTTASIWNTTIDITGIEDSNDYTFNISCNNGTDTAEDTNTVIIVDNTIPQAPTLSPDDNSVDSDGSITFTGTVTGSNTTGCTLYFDGTNPGQSSYTMTHSANTCTYSLASVPDQTYDWYVRASDGSNTTDSSIYTITSDVQTSAGKAAVLIQQGKVVSKGGATFSVATFEDKLSKKYLGIPLWLILVIIAIVVVVVIIRKK